MNISPKVLNPGRYIINGPVCIGEAPQMLMSTTSVYSKVEAVPSFTSTIIIGSLDFLFFEFKSEIT